MILNMDSVAALATLPADSIDLFVTSPPYDNLRTYGGHPWDFEGTARELYRVLKPGGVLCWNVNDETINGSESLTSCEQKIYFRRQCGFLIHDTQIYQKLNFSNPERIRYHQIFEYVFILSKGQPKTFNPICDRRNKTAGKIGSLGSNTVTQRDASKQTRARRINKEFGMRYNIWIGKTRGQEDMCKAQDRTAKMPRWLARDLILSWSNPADIVGDCFAGSGTTGAEARKLGRQCWLNDVDPAAWELLKAADATASELAEK